MSKKEIPLPGSVIRMKESKYFQSVVSSVDLKRKLIWVGCSSVGTSTEEFHYHWEVLASGEESFDKNLNGERNMMSRNISFMLTEDQIRNKTKTVTRRLGWKFLKKGDILNACVKCQGLKKGEKIEKICEIRVVDVKRERLIDMDYGEAAKEGFPDWREEKFIEFFCVEMGVLPGEVVTRIEFEYI